MNGKGCESISTFFSFLFICWWLFSQLFPQHIFGCFKHLYFLIESITLYLIESITLTVIELFSVFQHGARGAKWIYCQLNSRAPSQSQTILYTPSFIFFNFFLFFSWNNIGLRLLPVLNMSFPILFTEVLLLPGFVFLI